MNSWFINALIAMTAFGVMQALYKVPAAKGYNKFVYSAWGFITAWLLSFWFLRNDIVFDGHTILFGLAWGTVYSMMVLLQMQILKKLDTSASFPITSLGSHVLVVLIGVSFFHDVLSVIQAGALIATFLLIGFYNYSNKHITFSNGLIPTATSIVLLSTLSKFIQKSGAISTVNGNFTFWQLFFAAIASMFILFFMKNKSFVNERKADRKLLVWAGLLGLLNFVGNMALIKALSVGPFSLVFTINSFYILVSSIVAWKLFGEKLTGQKIVFILLAVIVIALIKLG